MVSVTMELVVLTMELVVVELELVAVELELVAVTLLLGWMRMRPQCKADVLVGAELRIRFVMKMGLGILLYA